MMATNRVTVSIRVAWWLVLYIHVLVFFCKLMETEPDDEKLAKVIERGIKVKPQRLPK